MTKKDKLNIAYQNIDVITKNVMNAINNDVDVDFNIEVNKNGTFLILVSTKQSASPKR